MKIAICDDDLTQTNYLSSLVRSWANNAKTGQDIHLPI